MERLRQASAVIARAYQQLMKDAGADVFDALWRIEEECRRNLMQQRLEDAAES